MWMDGKGPATLLTELSGLLRDTLMTHVAPKGARSLYLSGGYDDTTLGELSGRMTTEEIICAMETVQKYTASMRAPAPRRLRSCASSPLCDNTMGESIRSFGRISRLELQISSGASPQCGEDKHPTPAPAEEDRYEPELPAAGEETSIQEEDDLDPSRCSWSGAARGQLRSARRQSRTRASPNRKLCPKRTHRQGSQHGRISAQRRQVRFRWI